MHKDTFILRTNWGDMFFDPELEITDEQAGKMFKMLFAHANGIDYKPDLDMGCKIVIREWMRQIEAYNDKYADVSAKRRDAANKRWRKDAPQPKPEIRVVLDDEPEYVEYDFTGGAL